MHVTAWKIIAKKKNSQQEWVSAIEEQMGAAELH